MKKKLLAIAVAGALAAPLAAFAQTSVTIYGRANLSLDTWKATGATAGSASDFNRRNRVVDSGSRLGFRGTEDLGGGMRAYFVMEAGVNMDTGGATGQSGGVNASTGSLATRDSFVGLAGNWGEVSWGRQSMFWANGLNEQTGANYINMSVAGILTGHGMVAAPVARQSNVFYYTSPRLAGMWDIAVGYSPTSEAATAGTGAVGTTSVTGDKVWNLNVKFRTGPWYAQYDWAKRTNNTTATVPAAGVVSAREIKGNKIGVSYGYAPGSRFAVIYQDLRNNNVLAVAGIGNTVVGATATASGNNIRVPMWLFNLEHSIGPWQLLAGYLQAGNVRGASGVDTSNTKANAWHLGAKYNFSKRTGIYGTYNTVRNQSNAFADQSGGGVSSAGAAGLGAANEGADLKVWAFGLMHNF